MAIRLQDSGFMLHKVGGHDVFFEAANQDTTDATYQYFGYIAPNGAWIIQRFHIIASAIIYEYSAGKTRTDYDALWNAFGVYIGVLTFTTFDNLKSLL